MPKSIDKFTNEQKEVLQKIFNILEISNTNKILSFKKLDEDENKQKSIIDLENDIKKYFICSDGLISVIKNENLREIICL